MSDYGVREKYSFWRMDCFDSERKADFLIDFPADLSNQMCRKDMDLPLNFVEGYDAIDFAREYIRVPQPQLPYLLRNGFQLRNLFESIEIPEFYRNYGGFVPSVKPRTDYGYYRFRMEEDQRTVENMNDGSGEENFFYRYTIEFQVYCDFVYVEVEHEPEQKKEGEPYVPEKHEENETLMESHKLVQKLGALRGGIEDYYLENSRMIKEFDRIESTKVGYDLRIYQVHIPLIENQTKEGDD